MKSFVQVDSFYSAEEEGETLEERDQKHKRGGKCRGWTGLCCAFFKEIKASERETAVTNKSSTLLLVLCHENAEISAGFVVYH